MVTIGSGGGKVVLPSYDQFMIMGILTWPSIPSANQAHWNRHSAQEGRQWFDYVRLPNPIEVN